MENVFYVIGSWYDEMKWLSNIIMFLLSLYAVHTVVYVIVGMFFTRRFAPAKKKHKYAVLIPARNEEAVIGNLLDSIKRQDYPSELVTVFVVADNCTDNTAKIAREKGAVCYERFNSKDRTKGFALQFLFENIKKDYGIESFEGYFIFDSDNLLNKDYITKMNDAFDSGQKIITSYRNTKNFDENWVASTYALHWLRSIRFNHRARSFLRLATNLQGTGFLFANELVKDGWKYTSLTEDRAFTADAVAHGYEISYQDEAMFYDEQPTSLRVAFRQRTRWAKGHLLAFKESGLPLLQNVIWGNRYKKKSVKESVSMKNLIEEIRHRFAALDTLAQLVPTVIFKLIIQSALVFLFVCAHYSTGVEHILLFDDSNFVTGLLSMIFGDIYVDLSPGTTLFGHYFIISVFWSFLKACSVHMTNVVTAVYVFVAERKRIKKIPLPKKILFCFTWPVFDIIHQLSLLAALFMKVSWKAIPHTNSVTIQELEQTA